MGQITRSRVLKGIVGTLGVILVGALGSGVWQRLLDPLLARATAFTVNALSLVFKNYKDALYTAAAQGFHEEHSLMVYVFLLMTMTGFYAAFLVVLHRRRRQEDKREEDRKPPLGIRLFFPRNRKAVVIMSLFYGTAVVMLVLSCVQAYYSNRVTTYALNSIEILTPFIQDHESKTLRSRFLRLRTAKEFYDLNTDLNGLAKTNNVVLPTFKEL